MDEAETLCDRLALINRGRLAKDREFGWLRRISTTPVHLSRLLAAQLILNLLFAAAAIVMVIVGGQVIFGAPLTVGIPYFIMFLALAHCRDLAGTSPSNGLTAGYQAAGSSDARDDCLTSRPDDPHFHQAAAACEHRTIQPLAATRIRPSGSE
jgi:hypothetical protein